MASRTASTRSAGAVLTPVMGIEAAERGVARAEAAERVETIRVVAPAKEFEGCHFVSFFAGWSPQQGHIRQTVP